ncbi:MAG: hypothetical protein ABIQ60_06190 [Burkholderiaceae bacterium]
MGGMVTQLHLQADRPGRFAGENTQFSGRDFHMQKLTAVALAPDDFNGWVQRVRRDGVALDARSYQALSKRSTLAELRAALPVPKVLPPASFISARWHRGCFTGWCRRRCRASPPKRRPWRAQKPPSRSVSA